MVFDPMKCQSLFVDISLVSRRFRYARVVDISASDTYIVTSAQGCFHRGFDTDVFKKITKHTTINGTIKSQSLDDSASYSRL
jgi:hypothetical protein